MRDRSFFRFTFTPSIGPRLRVVICGLLLSGLGAGSIAAQYSVGEADTGSPGGEIPPRDELRTRWEDARWELGALRLQPWVGLDQVGYVTDQSLSGDEEAEESSDFTATVGAGLRGYVRLTEDLTIAAHVLPEYVWWRDADERSGLGGRYGLGLFGEYNRLRFGVWQRWQERQQFFSAEVQILTLLQQETTRAELEVEVVRNWWVYGMVEDGGIENTSDEPIFDLLDRDQTAWETGVRLRSNRGFVASLGVRDQEVEFDDSARPLSNEETAVILGASWSGQRIGVDFEIRDREIESVEGSRFGRLDETTGGAQVSVGFDSAEVFVLAERRFSYSLRASSSYFLEERAGLGFSTAFGPMRLRVLGAQGEVELGSIQGLDGARVDDFDELALTLGFDVKGLFEVGVVGSWRDYVSDDPLFDRDVARVGVTIQLGRLAEKLRLGDANARW